MTEISDYSFFSSLFHDTSSYSVDQFGIEFVIPARSLHAQTH